MAHIERMFDMMGPWPMPNYTVTPISVFWMVLPIRRIWWNGQLRSSTERWR